MSAVAFQFTVSNGVVPPMSVKKILFTMLLSHNVRTTHNAPRKKYASQLKPCQLKYREVTEKFGSLDAGFQTSWKTSGSNSFHPCSHIPLLPLEATPTLLISRPIWLDGNLSVAWARIFSIHSLRPRFAAKACPGYSPLGARHGSEAEALNPSGSDSGEGADRMVKKHRS